jgi:hypothetical protein
VRIVLTLLEILILSALILAARCANYQDVLVGENVYFTDADCYARMTRVRLCAAHPGLVLRHHQFENFPQGTTPHTTAPLDYLVLTLSILLQPFTNHAIDLAGAAISPLLALAGGWFLWWWSRRMRFRFRPVLLLLYAISPILVHGTELGRPDHQSLSILLVTIALCAEWTLQTERSPNWSIVNGIAWALAIWVSAYEPLLLLILVTLIRFVQDRQSLFAQHRRAGWICFAVIVALALVIERRIPSMSIFAAEPIFKNWARTIGELMPVAPLSGVWFRWSGYLFVVAPVLMWLAYRRRSVPLFVLIVLVATYGLTLWQARWAYFFMSIFAIALPALLDPIRSRAAVWIAFTLSILPIARDWDERLWPNEAELARRVEHRREQVDLRALALNMMSAEARPFLAPWWISPALAYWSGQSGVAGSSHESLAGIADSARFFLVDDPPKARDIARARQVVWVIAYDADRVAANSAVILGAAVPANPLCRSIDRAPTQSPHFLRLSAQNGTAKLFQVANNR